MSRKTKEKRRNKKNATKKWQKSETEEGILYTLNSDVKRTCLVKFDTTVEIRANGLLSSYPTVERIQSKSELKRVLEQIEKARFCVGTKEGRDCKNVFFPVHIRSSGLVIRCPSCGQARARERLREYRKEKSLNERYKNNMCIVENCPGRDSTDIYLFAIPEFDKEAWCHNLKLDVSEINDNVRVCSRHFEEECKNLRSLKTRARPTLNLEQDDNIMDYDELRYLRIRYCCIVGCKRTFPPYKLHLFPKERERLKQWLLLCVIKDEIIGHKYKYICSQHFEPSMLHSSDRLKADAIPKMDVANWLKNNSNTQLDALKSTAATMKRTKAERNSKLEPEVHAISEIQSAVLAKMEMDDETSSSNKSDSCDGLQCKNFCVTCATTFKDCETYSEACKELEKQLQELQTKTGKLKEQNEILISELESNDVYQEQIEIMLADEE